MRQVFISFHLVSSKAQRMKASDFSFPEWEKGDFPTVEGKLQSTTTSQCLEPGDDKGGREEKYMVKKANVMAWMPCKGTRQTVPSPCHGKIVMITASICQTQEGSRCILLCDLHKEICNYQPAMPHFSFQLGNLKPSPTYLHCAPHQPQHTDTICTVKFTLRSFKFLDKENLTHTHSHRIQSQEITSLQKRSIILLLVVSPAP